ncbi:MAG: hypothetical protein ACK4JB_12190 [Reyranella sp.]
MAPIGYIDGLSRGQIRGWVVDPEFPGRRVVVHVEAARGTDRRQVVADRYRADVHKQGIGDGYCGFAVPGKFFAPAARIRFLCGRPLREFGRFSLPPPPGKSTTFRRGALVVRLDRRPASAGLTGWALQRRDLEHRRRLLLCANGHILATQTATLFREDSLTEGGDGLHGFSLPPIDASSGLALVDACSGTAIALD